MKNKRTLLIAIILAAVVATVASFIFGFFGAKVSFDWNGGNQIKIICNDQESAKNAKIRAISLFNQHGISVDETELLTNGANEIVVIKTMQKEISEEIKTTIANKLNNIENAKTDGFSFVYSSYKTAAWVIPVTAVLLAFAASIALYIITKRVVDIIVLFSSAFISSVLLLSLCVLTRVQLGTNSVVALFVSVVLQTVITFIFLLRVKKSQNSTLKSEASLSDICKMVSKESMSKDGLFIIILLAASVVSAFINMPSTMYFGIILLFGTFTALFVAHYISLSMKVVLEGAFENRYNKKMVEKPAETPAKAEQKPARPTKQNKTKSFSKKRKRRKGNTETKVVV